MKKYGILLIFVVIAYGIGRYAAPSKVKTVTKIKVEKVVEEKIRIKTVTRKLPTGEVIITQTYQNDRKKRENSHVHSKKVEMHAKSQWSVALGRSSDSYQLMADRRVLGGASVGVSIHLNDQFKVMNPSIYLRYEF